MSDDLQTRESLIARLKDGANNLDWELFYRQYANVILSFCNKRGLDEFAARDVLQETMVLLIRKLPLFDYDRARGRFRNWLLSLVAGKTRDALRRSSRAYPAALQEGARTCSVPEVPLAHDSVCEVNAALEKAWRQGLVEEALRRIRRDPRIKPETFAVFHAYVVEGKPVADVAQLFNLQQNAIYQIKSRLLRRVRDEVRNLEDLDKPVEQSVSGLA